MTTAESAEVPALADFTRRLFDAVKCDDNADALTAILAEGGRESYPWLQDSGQGWSALHHAAHLGNVQAVRQLVAVGHPWNVLADDGRAAAQVAKDAGHADIYQLLVEEAVRSELLLNAIARSSSAATGDDEETQQQQLVNGDSKTAGAAYLAGDATYNGDESVLVDSDQNAVMMEWERGLMREHALEVCQIDAAREPLVVEYMRSLPSYAASGIPPLPQLLADCERVFAQIVMDPTDDNKINHDDNTQPPYTVLNVGFGLGLVDTYIQQLLEWRRLRHGQRTCHVIIEAHPAVLKRMAERGWTTTTTPMTDDQNNNVMHVMAGTWQQVVSEQQDLLLSHGLFHGIFFDTFGEDYGALRDWHDQVPNLLDCHQPSVYSFFNGLAGTNAYFHDVYNRVTELDLAEMGLGVEWRQLEVNSTTGKQEEWAGIQRNYYTLRHYDLAVCRSLDT